MSDQAALDRWWQAFVATGELPEELSFVQGRLIRMVHCGELPSGPVHVKTMAFPRAKDRLRYAMRALPAAHEAAMLRATRDAGIACPDVVAVRTARRAGLPHRSMLVLRTMPVVAEARGSAERLEDEVALAVRLLDAGIVHRDLHTENFVRLACGDLAVLDLQSASRASGEVGAKARQAVAIRLLRDRDDDQQAAALQHMLGQGLLRSAQECASVQTRILEHRCHYLMSRIRRCLMTSTEFVRTVRWRGTEYRLREGLGEGRWWRGAGSSRDAWMGQRVLQLQRDAAETTAEAGETPTLFRGFFRNWWWLGGGTALYVPRDSSDREIELAVAKATAAMRTINHSRDSLAD